MVNMFLVVHASSGGNLIESFAGLHLSDPFWSEASEVFGSLREAVQRPVCKIRNTSLATVPEKIATARLCAADS